MQRAWSYILLLQVQLTDRLFILRDEAAVGTWKYKAYARQPSSQAPLDAKPIPSPTTYRVPITSETLQYTLLYAAGPVAPFARICSFLQLGDKLQPQPQHRSIGSTSPRPPIPHPLQLASLPLAQAPPYVMHYGRYAKPNPQSFSPTTRFTNKHVASPRPPIRHSNTLMINANLGEPGTLSTSLRTPCNAPHTTDPTP